MNRKAYRPNNCDCCVPKDRRRRHSRRMLQRYTEQEVRDAELQEPDHDPEYDLEELLAWIAESKQRRA